MCNNFVFLFPLWNSLLTADRKLFCDDGLNVKNCLFLRVKGEQGEGFFSLIFDRSLHRASNSFTITGMTFWGIERGA